MLFKGRGLSKSIVLGIAFVGALCTGKEAFALMLTGDPCMSGRGFTLTTYASNFPSTPFGPLGIAFRLDGQVLVTNYADSEIYLLPNHNDFQDFQVVPFPVAPDFVPGQGHVIPLAQIQYGTTYKYFLGRDSTHDVVEITQDGAVVDTIATGITNPRGMAPYPALPYAPQRTGFSGHLFVCGYLDGKIWNVDPVAKTKTVFATFGGDCDGITFDVNGSHLYVALHGPNLLVGFNVPDGSAFWNPPAPVPSSGIDGLAIGIVGLNGYIYANYNSGDIWEFGLPGGPHDSSVCHIASGGSRGDFIAVDPWVYSGGSGVEYPSLLFTQTSEIVRLDPPGGGFFGPPTSTTVPLVGPNDPPLSVTKTASPSPVVAGADLTYTFTYANNGASAIASVIVKETIPACATFKSVSSGSCSFAGGVVTCNFGTLAAGGSGTFQVVVTAGPVPSCSVINNDNYTIEGAAQVPTYGPLISTSIVPPSLSVTKSASPSPVFAGADLTYTFTYQNTGSSAVTNVIVKETIPACATFKSVNNGLCSFAGGVVTCNFGTLAAGGNGTFQVVVTASTLSSCMAINNSNYTIEGTGQPLKSGPSVGTSILPILSVTKSASPSPVAPGADLTYTFTYQNNGSSAVTNVIVKETIPACATFKSVNNGLCSFAGGVVTCNFGTLAAGGSGTFQVVVTVGQLPSCLQISNGNYTIEGTGQSPTSGPLVVTNLVGSNRIPALNQWGAMMLIALLVGSTWFVLRRKLLKEESGGL